MCVQNIKRAIILLTVLALLGGCEAMDTMLPSAGTYKVNARINDLSLDEFSFISSGAKIHPFFEDSVSGDPDVTGLIVYLKDSKGEIAGWKVIYILNGHTYTARESRSDLPQKTQENILLNDDENLNEESEIADEGEAGEAAADTDEDSKKTEKFINGEELVINVRSLDNLPLFPLPSNLRMGSYTLVSQVLSGDDILDKTEKTFYYLAAASFSFDSILVHQPGVAESPQLISKKTVIMLEAVLDFDSGFDPYIVWYNGRSKISEGKYFNGAGNLLWEVPEQSGFFSLRAEAFPVANRQGLSGYVKDISLPVSTKTSDMHLLSEDAPNLLHWYIFEGNLNDSKNKSSAEKALKPVGNNSPKWMPAGGTYGLVTGLNDAYTLPEVSISNNKAESRRILCRFKPLDKGEILNVQFGTSSNVVMTLSADDDNLILTLTSPKGSASEIIALPETDLFITAKINFTALSDRISAALNVTGNFGDISEISANPIALEAEIAGNYTIRIGGGQNNGVSVKGISGYTAARNQGYSAIWDELAVIVDAPFESNSDAGINAEEFVEELPEEEEQPETGDSSGHIPTV